MKAIAVSIAVLLLSATCVAPVAPPTSESVVSTPVLTHVTLGLGYIPSVQFAPFYVALDKGFFADEGLAPEFYHGFETDFIKLVGTDEIQFAVGSGEEVVLARAQGLPVVYVLRWYRRFPVVVFAPKSAGLSTPAALVGHKVGIPGLFGASFVAWKALVYSTGLDESQVKLETIGFTQAEAVSAGQVDAALDYAVNGPVRLRLAGTDVDVISISDYIDLPSNGIITNERTIQEKPELVQAVVRAVLRGIRYTLNHPDEAFAISLAHVPEAGGENEPASRAVFNAVLGLWDPGDAPLGVSDPVAWAEAAHFMRAVGLVDADVDVDALYTNRFVTH